MTRPKLSSAGPPESPIAMRSVAVEPFEFIVHTSVISVFAIIDCSSRIDRLCADVLGPRVFVVSDFSITNHAIRLINEDRALQFLEREVLPPSLELAL